MSINQPRRRDYNIAVLGSGGVGKSCLTAQFVRGVWIESYDPTIEDIYRKAVNVGGQSCMLEIMDTAGIDQFASYRDVYINDCQGFLLVFSITSPSSLRELYEIYEEIVEKKGPGAPVVLVGNKIDLEQDRAVARHSAFQLAAQWKVPFYETSARRRINVNEVFEHACRLVMDSETQHVPKRKSVTQNKPKHSIKCVIL